MAILVAALLGILGSLALAYHQFYAPQRLAIQATRTAEASPTPVPAAATNTLTPTPNTPTPTMPAASATPTPGRVEIAKGRSIPTMPVFGEIGVKHPIAMKAGSSEMVAASIYKVPLTASSRPIVIQVTDAPLSRPPAKSDIALYLSTLFISEWMRVELEPAPDTFAIESLAPSLQRVNIDFDYETTYWMWVIKAPDTPGVFRLVVHVYLDEETEPVWVGGIQVRVDPE
jgi:hypothetical protein